MPSDCWYVLLAEAGEALRGFVCVLLDAEPTWALHLFVFEGNAGARRFYERHGGALVETLARPMPDGSVPPVCRYHWRDPARHLAALPAEA